MRIEKNVEILIFHKRIDNYTVQDCIIEKFKGGTIDTEKLRGCLKGLLSFRLNEQQRAVAVIRPYQGKTSLVVLDVLLDHKYENYSKDDSELDTLGLEEKIATEAWRVFERDKVESVAEGVAASSRESITRPIKWLMKVDALSVLDVQQLAVLEQQHERPIVIITGVAGAGKTLVAELLIMQERARNPESQILYITQSTNLVAAVKAHCQEAGIQTDIKTFQALCAPLIVEELFKKDNGRHYCEVTKQKFFSEVLPTQALAILSGDQVAVDADPQLLKCLKSHLRSGSDFISWVKKNTTAIVLQDHNKAGQLYQDICMLHNNMNFKNLGKKSLHHDRNVIEIVYQAYKKYLKENGLIDLALAEFPKEMLSQYDYILLDECQDFQGCQIVHIAAFLKENGHFYALIDTNQSIDDDFSCVYDAIKSLTANPKGDIQEYELKRGYRNGRKVIELANRLLHCGRLLVGGVLSYGLREIEPVEEAHPGYVEWIDVKKGEVSARYERLKALNPSRLEMVVVIPSNSSEDENVAKQLFPNRMVFTPKEIKGLEFDKVVLINFFNNRAFKLAEKEQSRLHTINWRQDDKLNKPKSSDNVVYNKAVVEAFVATTRAKQDIYIVQTSQDPVSRLFKKEILEDIFNKQMNQARVSSDASFEEICRFLEANATKLSFANVLTLCQEVVDKTGETIEVIDGSRINSLKKIGALLNARKLSDLTDKQLMDQATILVKGIETKISNSAAYSTLAPLGRRELGTAAPRVPSLSLVPIHRSARESAELISDAGALVGTRSPGSNFQEISIDEITSQQLAQVINGKTGLSTLLESRLAELEVLPEPAVDDLIRKITSNALSSCNDEGFSAIYLLLSSKKHKGIAEKMLEKEKFLSKVTGDSLNKLGPNGVPSVFYLYCYGEKFFKKIKKGKKIAPELLFCMEKHFPFFYSKKLLPRILFDSFGLLHLAAMRGDRTLANYAIKKGINLDGISIAGQTALHLLVQPMGNQYSSMSPAVRASFFKDLVSRGAAVNVCDALDGTTPIHGAASEGLLEIVQFLVEEQDVAVDTIATANRFTPLHMASNYGRLATVEYLVEKGADIHAREGHLITSLHFASVGGHLAIVEYLVEKGADIHAQELHLYTPLHGASRSGHLPVVAYLVEKGANIHAITDSCATSLHLAVAEGYLPTVKYLTGKGADIHARIFNGMTALHLASQNGHLAVVEYLVEKGANMHAHNNEGNTPLHKASAKGYLSIVAYLVEKGANMHAHNNEGNTPLHQASANGYLSIVAYLVEKGANIHAIDAHGATSLHLAVVRSYFSVVEYLVERGADIHATTANCMTSLYLAVRNEDLRLVGWLVRAGAMISATDKDGFTPLHAATQQENLAIVKHLVNKGADVNAANTQGITPLRCAADAGYTEIVKYLLDNQADVNAVADDGTTPLYAAAQNGYLSVVKILVLHGANVAAVDSDGNTPLHFAALNDHTAVMEYLIAAGAPVAAVNKLGFTLLHSAVQRGHLAAVKILVENGADASRCSTDGHTALAMARGYTHSEVVAYLEVNNGTERALASPTAKLVEHASATLTVGEIDPLSTGAGNSLGTTGRNSGDVLTHSLQRAHLRSAIEANLPSGDVMGLE